MQLDPRLLDTKEFRAELNAHGSYHPERFVLRLSPVVRAALDRYPIGIGYIEQDDFAAIQAMSTHIHETIHWWQHVGTTMGLIQSLSYPSQAHVNHRHLRQVLHHFGPQKSLRQLYERKRGKARPDSPLGHLRIVVNNQSDLNFFRVMTTHPKELRAIAADPYFESVGHAFEIALADVIAVLSSTFDRELNFLPDARTWDTRFEALRDQKVEGFYHGSAIGIPPLGTFEIFEGQARFSQLLYLASTAGNSLSWDDVEGMLFDEYISAFSLFLRLAELDWPPAIDDPVVSLFLLVCDLSVNPGEGFPLPLHEPARIVNDTDPGIRFMLLCRAIALRCPGLARAIRNRSRDEYLEVSEKLCGLLGLHSPMTIFGKFHQWAYQSPELQALLARHRRYQLDAVNAPIQLLFGHTLAIASDKVERPEFFCWTGAYLAGELLTEDNGRLYLRHAARFVDKMEDTTVVPTVPDGVDEKAAHDSFQLFFAGLTSYELTRQWISERGNFQCDLSWLQPAGTPEEFRRWCNSQFVAAYGVNLDAFEILS